LSRRQRLLFIAPTLPAEGGNGLAMRAGVFLEGLAADHDVTLLVVPVAGAAPPGGVAPFVDRHAARTVIFDLAGRRPDSHLALISRIKDATDRDAALRAYPRPLLTGVASPDTVHAATAPLAGDRFDFVHVMRLYLAPFAAPWLDASDRSRRTRCLIDLDDDEVRTHRSLAALHESNGDVAAAARETRESERYAAFEREYLPRFDRVVVAAPADQSALEARLPLGTATVVPNAVRLPTLVRGPRPDAWRLLFVGSLSYAPNADAAQVLCRTILPLLRSGSDRSIEVHIVGTRPPADVARLDELPGVSVATDVPSIGPYYARTRVAVAPIRAGGGTRIKVLEAFAHRCPVVATRVGAEGLDVRDGVHLLMADEPDRFAKACLKLLARDELADRLGEAAGALVASRHAVPVVSRRIAELCRELVIG
jgi:glycosyltransferase involved in cell wall biosynthesis